MKIAFIFVTLLHGLIHLMGFVKAFHLMDIEQLTIPISKITGLFWLFTCVLMLTSVATFLLMTEWWWIIAVVAIAISQVLIFMSWQDAKFGTIANLIILAFILFR